MLPHTFLAANVLIAAITTVLMFDMTRPPVANFISTPILQSLKPYLYNRSIVEVAFYNCVKKGFVLTFSMLTSLWLLGYLIPKTARESFYFMLIAIPISCFVANGFKYASNIKDLEPYYELVDVNTAESVNTLFSFIISYIGIKYFLPFL